MQFKYIYKKNQSKEKYKIKITKAGIYRRGKRESSDIDIIIILENENENENKK